MVAKPSTIGGKHCFNINPCWSDLIFNKSVRHSFTAINSGKNRFLTSMSKDGSAAHCSKNYIFFDDIMTYPQLPSHCYLKWHSHKIIN